MDVESYFWSAGASSRCILVSGSRLRVSSGQGRIWRSLDQGQGYSSKKRAISPFPQCKMSIGNNSCYIEDTGLNFACGVIFSDMAYQLAWQRDRHLCQVIGNTHIRGWSALDCGEYFSKLFRTVLRVWIQVNNSGARFSKNFTTNLWKTYEKVRLIKKFSKNLTKILWKTWDEVMLSLW